MAIDLFGQMAGYESVESLCPAQAEPDGDGGANCEEVVSLLMHRYLDEATQASIGGATREDVRQVAQSETGLRNDMRQQKSRRIAYLCLETPREGQAASTHVHEIVNGLKARGWNVELTTTSRGGASAGDTYVLRGLDYIAAQWRLIHKLGAVDAVYMRAHFAALPASIWATLRGKPVIQEINGKPQDILVTYPWLAWLGWLVKASYRWQLRLAARVIAVTEGLRQWCVAEAGHERVSLIPNGANIDLFTPEGNRPENMGDYVVFVGGLVAWHGIATML